MANTKFVLHSIQGKHRPRFTRQGRCYPDKSDVAYEKMVAEAYRAAGGRLIEDKPVWMAITIHRPLQKRHPKRIDWVPDTFKPDVDNIAKIVMDGLNGVAYTDDKQVVSLHIVKMNRTRVEAEDRIEIEINDRGYFD